MEGHDHAYLGQLEGSSPDIKAGSLSEFPTWVSLSALRPSRYNLCTHITLVIPRDTLKVFLGGLWLFQILTSGEHLRPMKQA